VLNRWTFVPSCVILTPGKKAIVTITRAGGAQRREERATASSDVGDQTAPVEEMHVLFKFGMTGMFEFLHHNAPKHKHAHVIFSDDLGDSVCFIDQRRFGRWAVVSSADDWGVNRGTFSCSCRS
jgi:hypothetical protein